MGKSGGEAIRERKLHCMGLHGTTGQPLARPLALPPGQAAKTRARASSQPDGAKDSRASPASRLGQGAQVRADLGESGWAVIFAKGTSRQRQDALEPLLSLRQRQVGAGGVAARFRVITPANAPQPGEQAWQYLKRLGVAPWGPTRPEELPHHLLLVGSPEDISFEFQYGLGVSRSVGRLHFEFEDEALVLQALRRYADSVVESEEGSPVCRSPAVFAPLNVGDESTPLSVEHLAKPLAKLVGLQETSLIGTEATKERLLALLKGPDRASLVFSAAHGAAFPNGADQVHEEGAIVCADYRVGRLEEKLNASQYVSRKDFASPIVCADFRVGNLEDERNASQHVSRKDFAPRDDCSGLILFAFSCFSAGTPKFADFDWAPQYGIKRGDSIAKRSFVAGLPQGLLANGALAVLGHVGMSWSRSFDWDEGSADSHVASFARTVEALLEGWPVGIAADPMSRRYADLCATMDLMNSAGGSDDAASAELAITRRDARNYTIVGDPAVRLRSNPQGA